MVKKYEIEFCGNRFIFSILSTVYLDRHSFDYMIVMCMWVLYWEFRRETSAYGKKYGTEFYGN